MTVYGLYDPTTGVCLYVGISSAPYRRLIEHASNHDNPEMRDWIHGLRRQGLEPTLRFLAPGTEAEWTDRLRPVFNIRRGVGKTEIKDSTVTLPAGLDEKVRELVKATTIDEAASALDVCRQTLYRILAGGRVSKGTVAVVTARLQEARS